MLASKHDYTQIVFYLSNNICSEQHALIAQLVERETEVS